MHPENLYFCIEKHECMFNRILILFIQSATEVICSKANLGPSLLKQNTFTDFFSVFISLGQNRSIHFQVSINYT